MLSSTDVLYGIMVFDDLEGRVACGKATRAYDLQTIRDGNTRVVYAPTELNKRLQWQGRPLIVLNEGAEPDQMASALLQACTRFTPALWRSLPNEHTPALDDAVRMAACFFAAEHASILASLEANIMHIPRIDASRHLPR